MLGTAGLEYTVDRIGSGDHPAYYHMGTRVLYQEQSGRGVMLTAHPHLIPRLRVYTHLLPSTCVLWANRNNFSFIFKNSHMSYKICEMKCFGRVASKSYKPILL